MIRCQSLYSKPEDNRSSGGDSCCGGPYGDWIECSVVAGSCCGAPYSCSGSAVVLAALLCRLYGTQEKTHGFSRGMNP